MYFKIKRFGNKSSQAFNFYYINDHAFAYCYKLQSVKLLNTLEEIGDYAFCECNALNSLDLHHDLTDDKFGRGIFYNCSNLTAKCTFPQSFTAIPPEIFSHCVGLTEFEIHNKITTIGDSAFDSCINLGRVNLTFHPDLTIIQHSAFRNCTNITGSLILPNTLIYIGHHAFEYCTGLRNTLGIPASIENISDYTFSHSRGLSSIVIPEGIIQIFSGGFYNCTGLNTPLVFPSTLRYIEPYAFYNCTGIPGALNLTYVEKVIGRYAFYNCYKLKGALTLGDGVTEIGNYSFYQCSGLTGRLKVSRYISRIDSYAFYGCSQINGPLNFSSNLEEIGNFAFYKCSNLDGFLYLGSDIQRIGSYAFCNCNKLNDVLRIALHSNCRIDDYAFSGCNGFTRLVIYNISYIGKFAFNKCTGFRDSLKILSKYQSSSSNYKIRIDDYAFYGCDGFKGELELPNDLYYIGNYAFYGCSGLIGNLTIPTSTAYIGDYAFANCNSFSPKLSLVKIYYEDGKEKRRTSSLQYIGDYAFYNCRGFTGDLDLPSSGLHYIGKFAFAECSFNGNMTMYEGNQLHIGQYAFNSTHFAALNYRGFVEPSYDDTIALSKETNVYVIAIQRTIYDKYTFVYRTPSFCTYNIYNYYIADNNDNEDSVPISLSYQKLEELQRSFWTDLNDKKNSDFANKTNEIEISIRNIQDDVVIPLFNNYSDNDVLKFVGKDQIKLGYNGGDVKLKLDPNSYSKSYINIDNYNDPQISILSSGNLNLETTASKINFNSTSNIPSDTLNIILPRNVDTLTFKELILSGESSINCRKGDYLNAPRIIPEISNLTANSNSEPTLSYITVTGPLNVKQTASIEIDDNVTLKDSDINYKLEDLSFSNSKPIFSGYTTTVPKSFNVELPDDILNVSQISDLLLFRGVFNCDDWSEKVHFDDTYFNKTECEDVPDDGSNARLLDDDEIEKTLVLKKNNNYVNPYGQITCSKSKSLSGGAIAGIVIACIVVVAAIIVGEYFLIMHFKNKKDASENEAEDVHNEA